MRKRWPCAQLSSCDPPLWGGWLGTRLRKKEVREKINVVCYLFMQDFEELKRLLIKRGNHVIAYMIDTLAK